MSPKHFECAGECDEGLFSVSGKMVQFADTFDSSMHIHVNGPWHIPAKACTPSSNLHHLAAIIPRMKFDTGSHQSRTNKNRAGDVICPPKHFGCAEECDQGLFSVSRKTVQFADTFDSSMHIHVNGPAQLDSSR